MRYSGNSLQFYSEKGMSHAYVDLYKWDGQVCADCVDTGVEDTANIYTSLSTSLWAMTHRHMRWQFVDL